MLWTISDKTVFGLHVEWFPSHVTHDESYQPKIFPNYCPFVGGFLHYNDVRMSAIASQIVSRVFTQRFIRRRSKKTWKLRVTGLCVDRGPVNFPAQIASYAENVSICWRHHALRCKSVPLQWRHTGRNGVSNYLPHDCLLNRLFGCKSKKTSKLRVTGLCGGIHRWPVNSPHKGPVTRFFFIWWRHHGLHWSPVTQLTNGSVMRNFDIFFFVSVSKILNKEWVRLLFEMLMWCHCETYW